MKANILITQSAQFVIMLLESKQDKMTESKQDKIQASDLANLNS